MPSPARVLALLSGLVVAATSAAPASARDRDNPNTAAQAANLGLHVGIGPALLIPSDGGPLGGGLVLDGRYGLDVAPAVIGPGGRLAGYYISRRFIGTAMPTLRVTLPVGPLAPYVVGGIGGGWLSNPGESGVALLGGGGLMIHFGRVLALGGEVTYQTITSTEFQILAFGPAIQF